jgi:amino acid transporter
MVRVEEMTHSEAPTLDDSSGALHESTLAIASQPVEEKAADLPPHMSAFSGVAYIIGCVVGTGIFRTVGGVQKHVGSVGASLLIWLFGGFLSVLGAFCYVELGTRFPTNGGDQVYLTELFGPLLGFLYTWVNVMARFPGTAALIGMTFSDYACDSVQKAMYGVGSDSKAPVWVVKGVGVGLVLVMAAVNLRSSKLSTKVTDTLFFVKVGMLLFISVAGIVALAIGSEAASDSAFRGNVWAGSSTDASELAIGLYSSLWAYNGW